jgi:hypothetical protein
VECFVKGFYLGRIGKPVGLGGNSDCTDAAVAGECYSASVMAGRGNSQHGSAATFRAAAHERHGAGVASDCNLEQLSDEMELPHNLTDAYPPGLATRSRT